MAFISTLPVRKIPGIGRVTEQLLGAFGVLVCGDIPTKISTLSVVLTPALLEFVMGE